MMKRPEPSAFTLIELLVVLAVLGLLASLLMPALSKVKEKARMNTCLGNLRQIGLALQLYESDAGVYPPLFQTNGGNLWKFQGAIGGKTGTFIGRAGFEIVPPAEERPLFRYLKVHETFHCPSDAGQQTDIHPVPSKFENIGCSYQYNAWTKNSIQNVRSETIADSSRYIVMYEPPAMPVNTRGGNLWYFQWHRRQGTPTLLNVNPQTIARFVSPILFLDGHVAEIDFTKHLLNGANPSASTAQWVWQNQK